MPKNLKDVHDFWIMNKRLAEEVVVVPAGVKPEFLVSPKEGVAKLVPNVAERQAEPSPPADQSPCGVLCNRTLLFHYKLAPSGCTKLACPYSHDVSNPSKRQVERVLSAIANQPAVVAALKEKTNFANMACLLWSVRGDPCRFPHRFLYGLAGRIHPWLLPHRFLYGSAGRMLGV